MTSQLHDKSRPQWHWWAQYAPATALRRYRPKKKLARLIDSMHMLRDGYACIYLTSLLQHRYDFGGILLNMPADVYAKEGPDLSPLPPLGNSLITVTTRSPLDDDRYDRRRILRSRTTLETAIFKGVRRFVKHCNRGFVILSDEVMQYRDEVSDPSYRGVRFNIRLNAYYSRRSNVSSPVDLGKGPRYPDELKLTLGYLIYVPHVQLPNGDQPEVLVLFGQSGVATLFWAHLLWKDGRLVPEILDNCLPRLVVGEFCVDLPEDTRPADVASFAPKEFAIKLDATLPDHRTNNNGRTLEAIG